MGMKEIRKKLVIVLAVVSAIVVGCVPVTKKREPLPEDTIEAFERAYNTQDVEGVLECLDEKTVKALTTSMDIVLNIAQAITEVDFGITMEDIMALLPIMQELIVIEDDEFDEIDFQVTETYIRGNKATVHFYEVNSGTENTVNMNKESDGWKFSVSTRYIKREDADRVIIAGENESKSERRAETGKRENSLEQLESYFHQLFGG